MCNDGIQTEIDRVCEQIVSWFSDDFAHRHPRIAGKFARSLEDKFDGFCKDAVLEIEKHFHRVEEGAFERLSEDYVSNEMYSEVEREKEELQEQVNELEEKLGESEREIEELEEKIEELEEESSHIDMLGYPSGLEWNPGRELFVCPQTGRSFKLVESDELVTQNAWFS
jgi:predicted ribosome quality control (RQC) complex YloA/Tae2 family protein